MNDEPQSLDWQSVPRGFLQSMIKRNEHNQCKSVLLDSYQSWMAAEVDSDRKLLKDNLPERMMDHDGHQQQKSRLLGQ